MTVIDGDLKTLKIQNECFTMHKYAQLITTFNIASVNIDETTLTAVLCCIAIKRFSPEYDMTTQTTPCDSVRRSRS